MTLGGVLISLNETDKKSKYDGIQKSLIYNFYSLMDIYKMDTWSKNKSIRNTFFFIRSA